jgi:diguanylate cyclase (GGDEF)-like protein
MPVMDIFDDFYELCEMLLEIEQNEAFWDILSVLEKLTKSAGIINLQRKIVALKIRHYRMYRNNAEYLQAAGLFYELTEAMERENRYMMSNMLGVRSSLERANAKRREVEMENLELQRKSETDALTKLANRFRLNTFSENAFERALREQTPLAVEILDIDYFKQYNDNYGHQAGDECISSIARILRHMQNDRIFCARYGGDEFIVIYEDMTEEAVRQKAEHLRQQIMDLRIVHEFSPAYPIVTISQGICYDIPKQGNKNWDYLHCADNMLYKVKKESRNSILLEYLEGAAEA